MHVFVQLALYQQPQCFKAHIHDYHSLFTEIYQDPPPVCVYSQISNTSLHCVHDSVHKLYIVQYSNLSTFSINAI